jgi:hypothetical protein
MIKLGTQLGLTLGASLFLALACGDIPGERLKFKLPGEGSEDGTDELLDYLASGPGVGEVCDGGSCRLGLTCNSNNECEPTGSTLEGETCLLGVECATGLTCVAGACPLLGAAVCPICQPAGAGVMGDGCQSDLDCTSGWRCGLDGPSGECVEAGTADLGTQCAAHSDCYQGLFCNTGACSVEPPL